MPGRIYRDTTFRFGYNNKEKDDETYGRGNEYDYGARIYNPRLAKWLSPDPLANNFPSETPYNYTSNNPIIYVDRQGQTKWLFLTIVNEQKNTTTVIKIKVNDELKHVPTYHNSDGLGSGDIDLHDWHDINLSATIVVKKNGKIQVRSKLKETRGEYRYTTNFNLGSGYVNFSMKVSKAVQSVKEDDVPEGTMFVVNHREGDNNEDRLNKGAKHIDGVVNISLLIEALEACDMASSARDIPETKVEALSKMIDYTSNLVKEGVKLGEGIKELDVKKSFVQCQDGCGQYAVKGLPGVINDTSGQGITPQNTTKVSHEQLMTNGTKTDSTTK